MKWQKLLKHPNESEPEFYREQLETILNDMGRLYTDLPLELLLGIATFKGTDLIEFRGKGIQSVSSFGVIGCGDSSLIRYLADSAEKFWITLQEGFLLSAYILKRAEEYIDGCHGPMDFACLTQGPKMTIIEPSIIEKVDGLMKENQPKAFRDLLSIAWTLPT